MSNGMESLIHRDYAALVAAVPLIAAGAVATSPGATAVSRPWRTSRRSSRCRSIWSTR